MVRDATPGLKIGWAIFVRVAGGAQQSTGNLLPRTVFRNAFSQPLMVNTRSRLILGLGSDP
jgi:hypothetical protein